MIKNYYEILGLQFNAPEDEIFKSYREKISQFNGLPFLTKDMINDIKLLKEAFYVLSDIRKKDKYIKKYKRYRDYESTNKIIDNTKICDRLFSIVPSALGPNPIWA
jgi:curved DNA-binding protein CbpA